VRSRDLNQNLAGLPLEMVRGDARGMEVKRQRFKLSAAGLEEFSIARVRNRQPAITRCRCTRLRTAAPTIKSAAHGDGARVPARPG